jgi:ubiquitin carboxyl-terminal hydrolase 8
MGSIVAVGRKRWEPLIGKDEFEFSETAGVVGLRNLGNTCFMNSGLQCLCHIEPFTAYFLSGKYRDEINCTNPLGSGGKLASAIADLQKHLWQRRQSTHSPKDLHRALQKCAPHLFDDYEQQDVQEFLAFCLDGLHEDLNLVTMKPPPASEDELAADAKLVEGRDEEFAAALAWMRYLERGKSFLVDLFQGQLRSSLTCMECGLCNRQFEPFLYLSVPVHSSAITKVTDCIGKYLEEEILSGDERWMCSRCNRKVDARKKIDLWKLPPVLVLHLKRFEFDMKTLRFRKIDKLLESTLTIDLMPFVSSSQKEHAIYDVTGIANHFGAFGSGHYTAYCRVNVSASEEGEWHHFNDDSVSHAKPEDVITKSTYVMFLIRRSGEGTAIRRQSVSLPEVWPHWVSTRNSAITDLLNPVVEDEAVSTTGVGSANIAAPSLKSAPSPKSAKPQPSPKAKRR